MIAAGMAFLVTIPGMAQTSSQAQAVKGYLGGQRLLSFISQLKAVGVTLFIISPRKVVQHPEWAPLEVKGSVDCATQSVGTQKCLPLVAGRAPLEWVDHPETHLYSLRIAQDKREVLPVECNPR